MNLHPLSVLVIDDNQAQGDGLAELLGLRDFNAKWVSTGQAGLD